MSSGINDLEVTARALSPAPGLPVSSFTVPTQGNIPLEHTQYLHLVSKVRGARTMYILGLPILIAVDSGRYVK